MTASSDPASPAGTHSLCQKDSTRRIREFNDAFRRTLTGGRVLLTNSVSQLDQPRLIALLSAIRDYDAFSAHNDPYAEHDFGSIDANGERFFWKIDYYDRSMTAGSPDPANPAVTQRVLTVMRSDEY